jgi:glutathione S-transferase
MYLYWSGRSPYVRKVMMAAHEAGLASAIELRAVVVTLRTRHAEVVKANPMGQIPTLVLDDGTALYGSTVICDYIAAQAPGAGLLPDQLMPRLDALRRQALGDGATDALIRWYSERTRFNDKRGAEYVAVCRDKLIDLAAHLEACPPGDRWDLGDIAIACALSYADFRFSELDWRAGHPRLARWYSELTARPSFLATAFAQDPTGP